VIYTLDPRGYITYISSAVEKTSGYNPKELIGYHFSQFVYSADVFTVIANHEILLKGESTLFKARLLDKFNQIHYVSISSRPLMENERVTGIMGIIEGV
jgi:PAS domain S-box-containing protein